MCDLLKSFCIVLWNEKTHHYIFFQDQMVCNKPTLHLEVECTWGRWIPDVIKDMDHFLRYLCYTQTFIDLCLLCSFHTKLGVRDDCSKSMTFFLLYVFDLGRLRFQYFCLCVYTIVPWGCTCYFTGGNTCAYLYIL